ncbi:MAG: hypothetical protein AB7F50_02695 [Fimbriimonadaceae bacterium]
MGRTWFFALLVVGTAGPALAGGTYRYRLPMPMGELLYAKPEVRWAIWSDDGMKVTDVRLLCDGNQVPARYDSDARAVVYSPTKPLAVGNHKFECTVTLDDRHTARQDWSVRVRPDAAQSLPQPSPTSIEAAQALNRIRARLGLGPVKTHLALTAASGFQTKTIAQTGNFDHVQGVELGSTPGDRAMLYGYGEAVSELLSSGITSPSLSVRSLYDAPYHRIPLLALGRPDFGASVNGDVTALLVSEGQDGMTVSPANEEQGVPTSWDGIETPSPTRDAGIAPPFGYPVVVALFGQGEWALLKSEIAGPDGKPVTAVLRHRGNDSFAGRAVILVPTKPLRPGTKYRATVAVLTGSGTKAKTWSFTTDSR